MNSVELEKLAIAIIVILAAVLLYGHFVDTVTSILNHAVNIQPR